ncbi:hypothetical protein KI387_024071, partial [Taxus chinensis]
KNHSYEEFPDLYKHLSKQHKEEKKCTRMVRIHNVVKDKWMPKIVEGPDALKVKITTHVEVARIRESFHENPTITKEEVLH